MSDNSDVTSDSTSGDELVSLLAQRGKRGRAKSTTILVALLLVLLGVLIGIAVGRATASSPAPSAMSQAEPQSIDAPGAG